MASVGSNACVPPAQQWGWALLDSRDDVFAALRGVAVNSVEEGGAAARSGIAPGDVIHAVAGRNLESLSDFKGAMVEAFLTGSLELELEVSQQREQVTLWWERTEGAEELARREAEQLSLAMAESEASATPRRFCRPGAAGIVLDRPRPRGSAIL